MHTSPAEEHPLRRLFSGAVQHALYVDVGLCDPQLAEYLTDLLSTHVHMDDLYPFKDASGRRLTDLAAMMTDAHFTQPLSPAVRERLIHRHIGDFALFWTGLFPEGLRRLGPAGVGNRLSDYMAQGKRSYAIASELAGPQDKPPPGVFRRLSESFEYCVHGLNLCRRDWLAAQRQASGR
ncbi:MAG: hypothetical protein HRF43_04365 [Phycisphaerae bacterium]|jgi:hypothetical protein